VRATFFGHAPSFHGPADFETMASGWMQGGRVGAAFEALATETSRQQQEARSRQQLKRDKSDQRLKARHLETRAWLGESSDPNPSPNPNPDPNPNPNPDPNPSPNPNPNPNPNPSPCLTLALTLTLTLALTLTLTLTR